MEKRRLVKKYQNQSVVKAQAGWRAVNNTKSSGTWGNRGKGNEGESLLENGLSFIKSIPERIDNASRGFKTNAQVIKELGYNPHTHYKMPNGTLAPIMTGIAPTPSYSAGRAEAIMKATKITPAKDVNGIYRYRRAINSDDRFYAGEVVLDKLRKSPQFKNKMGHGVTKASNDAEALGQVRNILTQGTDPSRNFYTASFIKQAPGAGAGIGTSSGNPYMNGPFVLVTEPGINTANNPRAFTHVLINDSYENPEGYNLARKYQEVLSKEFPNVKSILYSEIK